MGCTSSTPNMNNSCTAEKSIQFEEDMVNDHTDDVEEILYRSSNDVNETSVLPMCDKLDELLHLDRNRSSTSLDKIQQDKHQGHNTTEAENESEPLSEEKIPKLEKLVDKVLVQNFISSDNNTISETKYTETESIDNYEEIKEELHELTENAHDNHVENNIDVIELTEEKNVDEPEETQSPSRSESSRATRWEALADIAAELPPSLMVDPITGQIYAVSK